MSARRSRRVEEDPVLDGDVPVGDDTVLDEDVEDADENVHANQDLTAQLVKKMVRYAMACEFGRQPIRREGIREKVLGPHARLFKRVFAGAQKQLINTFGMELREMPTKDRATLTAAQRRKAMSKSQGTQQSQTVTNSYMLVSILPDRYREAKILPPSKIQSAAGEASYMAIVSILVSVIILSGGELSEPRLRRHLTRFNLNDMMPSLVPSDRNAPVEKTEVALQRMIRQGYLVKVTDKSADEGETITWFVGPRGRVEVDNEVIANMIRTIYGGSSDELEAKLQASLGVKDKKALTVIKEDEDDEAMGDVSEAREVQDRNSGRLRQGEQGGRQPVAEAEEDDEEEEVEADANEGEEEDEEEEEEQRPAKRRASSRRQTEPQEDIYDASPIQAQRRAGRPRRR